MPVHFTDERVLVHGPMIGFREKKEEESIEEYRAAIAEYEMDKDPIEAMEVLFGLPWNLWTKAQKLLFLTQFPNQIKKLPLALRWAVEFGIVPKKD